MQRLNLLTLGRAVLRSNLMMLSRDWQACVQISHRLPFWSLCWSKSLSEPAGEMRSTDNEANLRSRFIMGARLWPSGCDMFPWAEGKIIFSSSVSPFGLSVICFRLPASGKCN